MTAFIGWTPPPGVAVVPPPCHVETTVDLMFSDRSELAGVRAGSQNWSAVGDGPSIVAYAVVEEYKPAPREVVAWAVVKGDGFALFEKGGEALNWSVKYGGTAVKLIGVLPNE